MLWLNIMLHEQNGETSLSCAALSGDVSLVKFLLENGGEDYINEADKVVILLSCHILPPFTLRGFALCDMPYPAPIFFTIPSECTNCCTGA